MALESAPVDIFDRDSVRRGAGYFAHYCLGCHGLKQIRYSRIGSDLGIDEATLRREFMFGDTKLHDYVRTAMPAKDAEAAFGVVPPDLSLIVRARGADWIYSYLKGFYVDPSRPFGVNNVLAKNVAMPNVLWDVQGSQEPIVKTVEGTPMVVGARLTAPGKQTPQEFARTVADLVNFLAYVAEPAKLQRLPLGKYVLAYLLILTVILYKLKKAYWKDIE